MQLAPQRVHPLWPLAQPYVLSLLESHLGAVARHSRQERRRLEDGHVGPRTLREGGEHHLGAIEPRAHAAVECLLRQRLRRGAGPHKLLSNAQQLPRIAAEQADATVVVGGVSAASAASGLHEHLLVHVARSAAPALALENERAQVTQSFDARQSLRPVAVQPQLVERGPVAEGASERRLH